GLAFLMIFRALISIFRSPAAALENLIPLVLAFILALVISSGIGLLARSKFRPEPKIMNITWGNGLWAVGLGLGIFLLQLLLP
ncbi:MAG: hypothetical protein P8Y37_03055, partial [Anaerolineales bacterium]